MEKKYYIVRADRAGVFFGKIKEQSHDMVTMTNVRKIFYWDGACAVEELATIGTKKPNQCKITVQEFIEITENDYGSSVIKKLKERIE